MKPNTKKQVTYSCSFAEMAQLFEDAIDGCFTFDTVSYEDFIKFLKEHSPNIVLQFGARTPDFIKELERLRNIALKLGWGSTPQLSELNIEYVFPNKDKLVLTTTTGAWYGLNPGTVLSLFYAEKYGEEDGSDCYNVCRAEYFKVTDIPLAVQALTLRLKSAKPHKDSNLGSPLEDILGKINPKK